MALNPFILLPLYIYPESGLWDPLFTAASAHPAVDFQVIVNPWTGPGEGSCSEESFTSVLQQVQQYPNIRTLGYVHTANAWDCGESGTDICVTSAPAEEVKGNVTTYSNWASEECGALGVDGIFFDESPSTDEEGYVAYMADVSAFAKATLGQEAITMFNAGTGVSAQYWDLADYICVLENSGSTFESFSTEDLDELTSGGKYADQATFILYDYEGDLRADVQDIVGKGISGVSVTDAEGYVSWGKNWMDFVRVVDEVVNGRGS